MSDNDLPAGYRWADADETERIAAGDWTDGYLVVPRTADANGVPYTQDEADIAVPIDEQWDCPRCENSSTGSRADGCAECGWKEES